MKRFFTPSRGVWAIVPLLGLLLLATVFWFTANPASAQPGLITGVAADPDGNLPPPGTTVILVAPDGNEYGQGQADPSTGQFSLGPVANGNYVLQARPPQASPLTPSYPLPSASPVTPLTSARWSSPIPASPAQSTNRMESPHPRPSSRSSIMAGKSKAPLPPAD